MNRYRLTATPISPLVVRRERQSQRSEGVESLSGTLLRGALAQLYLEQHGQTDEHFHRLFLDADRCRYGPLDPAEHIFPLSAASCKRVSGFKDDDKHGIVDLLWLRIARRLREGELPLPWPQRERQCRTCGQDLKAKEGFWTRQDGKARELKKLWRRGTETHVGIDRLASSASEAILYTLPVLIPRKKDQTQARLTGVLQAGVEEVEQLRHLLEGEGEEIRIGHARTRGYGRVRLEIGPAEEEEQGDPEGWSRELIAFLAQTCPEAKEFDPARHFFFSLGLPNGALLLDHVLRYSLDPSGMVDWLPPLPPAHAQRSVRAETGQPFAGGNLWCLGGITRHERLRGWNAAHGLPRQDESVVIRGAVYAYLFEGDDNARRALREKLAGLEKKGLGTRRAEGLGRVIVSDEIHQRFHPGEAHA